MAKDEKKKSGPVFVLRPGERGAVRALMAAMGELPDRAAELTELLRAFELAQEE